MINKGENAAAMRLLPGRSVGHVVAEQQENLPTPAKPILALPLRPALLD
jgi:hypothetical protein